MQIALSDEFRNIRTQIYTFGMIYLSVRYFPLKALKFPGVSIDLDATNAIIVELSLAIIILFLVISAIPCLCRDSIGTSLEILTTDTQSLIDEAKAGRAPDVQLDRLIDKFQFWDQVSNWCESLFPIIFGITILFIELYTVIRRLAMV